MENCETARIAAKGRIKLISLLLAGAALLCAVEEYRTAVLPLDEATLVFWQGENASFSPAAKKAELKAEEPVAAVRKAEVFPATAVVKTVGQAAESEMVKEAKAEELKTEGVKGVSAQEGADSEAAAFIAKLSEINDRLEETQPSEPVLMKVRATVESKDGKEAVLDKAAGTDVPKEETVTIEPMAKQNGTSSAHSVEISDAGAVRAAEEAAANEAAAKARAIAEKAETEAELSGAVNMLPGAKTDRVNEQASIAENETMVENVAKAAQVSAEAEAKPEDITVPVEMKPDVLAEEKEGKVSDESARDDKTSAEVIEMKKEVMDEGLVVNEENEAVNLMAGIAPKDFDNENGAKEEN